MSDEEFNRRIDELIGGLPITLVTTRLVLALKAAVDAGGQAAANALRHMAPYNPDDYDDGIDPGTGRPY